MNPEENIINARKLLSEIIMNPVQIEKADKKNLFYMRICAAQNYLSLALHTLRK